MEHYSHFFFIQVNEDSSFRSKTKNYNFLNVYLKGLFSHSYVFTFFLGPLICFYVDL